MLQAIVHQGVRAALLIMRPAQLSIPEMTKPPQGRQVGRSQLRGGVHGFMPEAEGSMDRRLPGRGTLASAYQGKPDESPASTGCMWAENSAWKR